MNARKPLFAAIITALTLGSTAVLAANGPSAGGQLTQTGTQGGTQHSSCPAVTTTQASEAEAQGLAFMREEEKLARDVYQALGAQWQLQIFGNIGKSEQEHMDQVKCLLDAFGLADSATTEAGRFNNTDLQSLYDALMARGSTALLEALKVGALIEETDIADLHKAIAAAQTPEIKIVYNNLLMGSENHLRAFNDAIKQQGETYVPQILDATTVTAILNEVSSTSVAPPVVFDLDSLDLMLPQVHLRQAGNLLPETYTVRMRVGDDGRSFVIIDLQARPR